MDDGVIVKGEANIPTVSNHIREVFYDCEVEATPEAVKAIRKADLIIYGIGSVYTSILPNVIIPEIRTALRKTKAKRVYFCNAMTQPGETDGYSVEDHVQALIDHGAPIDAVVVAEDEIPSQLEKRYQKEGSTVVRVAKQSHSYEIIRRPLLCFDRELVRHDPQKIQEAVETLIG